MATLFSLVLSSYPCSHFLNEQLLLMGYFNMAKEMKLCFCMHNFFLNKYYNYDIFTLVLPVELLTFCL